MEQNTKTVSYEREKFLIDVEPFLDIKNYEILPLSSKNNRNLVNDICETISHMEEGIIQWLGERGEKRKIALPGEEEMAFSIIYADSENSSSEIFWWDEGELERKIISEDYKEPPFFGEIINHEIDAYERYEEKRDRGYWINDTYQSNNNSRKFPNLPSFLLL